MAITTHTVTFYPSGRDNANSVKYSTTTSGGGGLNPTSGGTTAYDTIQPVRTQGADTYQYYTFDVSSIPQGSVIASVSGKIKTRVANTSSTYFTTKEVYFTVGSTPMQVGTSVAINTNQVTVFSIPAFTVQDRSSLDTIEACVHLVRGTQNSSAYFYGADLTVTYYEPTYHDVEIDNDTQITVSPATDQTVLEGSDLAILLYVDSIDGITITDNGNDVTSQLDYVSSGTTSLSLNPTHLVGSTATVNNQSNAYAGTGSTTYAQMSFTGSGYMDWGFDFDPLPFNATITSISCAVKCFANSSMTGTAAQLYSGEIAKGSPSTIPSTAGGTVLNLSCGSWTASEFNDVKLRLQGTVSSSKPMNIYGAEVQYTTPDSVYVYQLEGISEDHVIVISSAGSQERLYIKKNGQFVTVLKVYKKAQGTWQEQSDLSYVFDEGNIYVKGN